MIRGTITYQGSPDHTLAVLKRAVKEGLNLTGHYWHDKILPRHFETGAAGRYNYKKRTKNYMKRKARKKGHQRPLVFSGRLEREVKRKRRVSSTSKRVTVRLYGPKYLWQYRKDLGASDKAAELTAVTVDEVKEQARVLDRNITRLLRSAAKRKRRIKKM